MNAPAPAKLDEIHTFLGDIPAEEYERRDLLRSYRNAATFMISTTRSDTARLLAWQVIEWVAPYLYSPAPIEWLDDLNRLAKRLLLTAMQAEDMQSTLEGSEHGE